MEPSKSQKNKKESFEFSQDCQIATPEKWSGFPMHKRDWDRLKRMAGKIVTPWSFWGIVWPASFGISISCLIGGLTILEKGHTNKTLCYWLFGIFLITGILTIIIDLKHKKGSGFNKDQLVEEMEKIEEPHKNKLEL